MHVSINNCESLTSVKLPDGIKVLGKYTFSSGRALKKIELPDSLIRINAGCFEGTGITSLRLPEKIEYFSPDAFGEFDGSKSLLKKISISDKNKNYSVMDNVLYNKDKTELIMYPANRENKSFIIPDTVKKIGKRAFNNLSLDSLTINGNIKTIGSESFTLCIINNLSINSGVETIGMEAFYFCTIKGKVVIPDSVKFFSRLAFDCSKLESFTVPKCVTKIGDLDLYFEMNEVIIPPTVTSIHDDALGDYKPTVKGKKGTAAEKFAKKNRLKFVEV